MSHMRSSSSKQQRIEISSWSDLPSDLLPTIAERLHLRSDILNFRLVCQSWRASAPLSLLDEIAILSPILPHDFSIDPSAPDLFTRHPLRLVATSVFLIQSLVNPNLQPWLCSVEEVNPGKLHLLKSLSRDTEKQVFLKHLPKQLSLPCFRVSEISSVCTLSYAPHKSHEFRTSMRRRHSVFEKAVLYLESDNNKCESNISADDYALMVLYGDISNKGSLAKISLKDRRFSQLMACRVKKFDDVVCFKRRVCVIDRKGRLYREENDNLECMVKELVREESGSGRKKRLVVELSNDELYLVYRCPKCIGVPFMVYKLNEAENKWKQLTDIGERIIVATHNGCFFVQTKDVPTWRNRDGDCLGNCLVFSRRVFPAYGSISGGDSEIFKASEGRTQDFAIFYFGSGKCELLENDCENDPAKVLWPPPAWLSSDTQLSK